MPLVTLMMKGGASQEYAMVQLLLPGRFVAAAAVARRRAAVSSKLHMTGLGVMMLGGEGSS